MHENSMNKDGVLGGKKLRIAYCGVVGDLFHYGHLQSLLFAKSISDVSICGVFTDEVVETYREKPIANFQERLPIFQNLRCVDRVMIQNERDPTDNLKRIHEEFPDAEIILVHGDDLSYVHGSDYVKEIGGRVAKHPYYQRLSTFKIINTLLERKDKIKDIKSLSSYITDKEDLDEEAKRGNKFIISSKADTLKALKPLLKKSKVEGLYSFSVQEWENRQAEIIQAIQTTFGNTLLVVRNSVIKEHISAKFDDNSFPYFTKIDSENKEEIISSVQEIISAYEQNLEETRQQQILIQPSVEVMIKGNAYPSTSGKYLLLNCDYFSQGKRVRNETFRISPKDKEIPTLIGKAKEAIEEIQSLIPNMKLDVNFAISKEGEVYIFDVNLLSDLFVHGWGGTTSIQSLECHTLRYVDFPKRIGNAIDRRIFCEIRKKHHTVYFDKKDVERWNNEGIILLEARERERIIKDNLEQIERFFSFYVDHKNTNFAKKTDQELSVVYSELLNLVMENGSFFPYSREETVKPIKDKVMELLKGVHNPQKILQKLTTPVEEDLFLREQKERLVAFKDGSKEGLMHYATLHPWRFINTYSSEAIYEFLRQEQQETNLQDLQQEITQKEEENRERRIEQEKLFKEIDNHELQELCMFLQKIAVVRLENKNIWAGYEYLFLGLFEEIASRLELSIEDFLYTYRIEEIKEFLIEGRKLSLEDITRRLKYFNLEIFPHRTIVGYKLKYGKELEHQQQKEGVLVGEAGNLGKVVGRALVVTDDSISSLMKLKKEMTSEDIYITTMTHPAMVSLLHKAKGIVTDEGGITSHAAIISREMDIPCLVGTRVATRYFKTGDIIELDSYNKKVKKVEGIDLATYNAQLSPKQEEEECDISVLEITKPKIDKSIPYTLSFSELLGKGNLVGGKGANLGICFANHTVPDGFSITRRLYDEILGQFLGEREFLRIDLESDAKLLETVREFIKDYKFPEELVQEVETRLSSLRGKQFAVRSSASCEDSAQNSFAGQFSSYLGVKKEGVIDAVKDCLCSAFMENVFSYIALSKLSLEHFFMSVVVQKFVESEKSGVLFSQNPSDPLIEGFWIDANFGVGESVVSGEVKPDQYFVHAMGVDMKISDEKEAYSYASGNLSSERKEGRVLEDSEIQELVDLGKRLKDYYDKEIECEWAYFENKLHLLQVRPITVIREE